MQNTNVYVYQEGGCCSILVVLLAAFLLGIVGCTIAVSIFELPPKKSDGTEKPVQVEGL